MFSPFSRFTTTHAHWEISLQGLQTSIAAIEIHLAWANLNSRILNQIQDSSGNFSDVNPLLKEATEFDYLSAWQTAWDETSNYLIEIDKLLERLARLRNLLPQGDAEAERKVDLRMEGFKAELGRLREGLDAVWSPDLAEAKTLPESSSS